MLGQNLPGLPAWLDLLAMSLSGFFGAVVAANRKAPALGIIIGGLLIGLGGGIVRDVLLNTMPISISQWNILPSVTAACILGGLCAGVLEKSRLVLVILQACTLGLLLVIGAEKAIDYHVSPWAVILLGLITASAGGAMFDAICGQRAALISQGHWHVSALIAGAIVFLLLYRISPPWVAETSTVAVVILLRVISYELSWSCPVLPGSKKE